jgi:histidine triad (HIT) family protein
MSDCLFCKIIAGEIPAKILYETDTVLAFEDISPQAPLHALVIPKKHIAMINDIQPEDTSLMGEMYLAAKEIAAQAGYADSGYRTVMNCGADAGQTVFHIHLHVLGGRNLAWPPG